MAAIAHLSFPVVLAKVVTITITITITITTFVLDEGGHHHCHLRHLHHPHAHLVLGEGDCDSKEDCQGNLVCGKDNCEGEWFEEDDDCCIDIGNNLDS